MNTIMKRTSNGSNLPIVGFPGLVDSFFQNNLNRLFDDSFWGFDGIDQHRPVPVNIRETDKAHELEIAAPGFKKEDFKIDINGEVLTVSAEHKEQSNEESKYWKRHEYKKQSFSRSFSLDNTVEFNKIEASYKDGMLHLLLPKNESAQQISRTIEIQ